MKNIIIRQLTSIMIVVTSASALYAESLITDSLLKTINTDGDETSCAITGSGDFFLFARTPKGKENSDLYFTEFKNGKWTSIKAASELNSASDDISPYISEDGKFVLFASNRKGSLKSSSSDKPSYDIYYSERKNGKWQKPVPLSGAVNTTDDELNPFISKDGNRLFITRSPFDYRTKTLIVQANRKDKTWDDISTAEISNNSSLDVYMMKKSLFRTGFYISGFKNGDISNSEIFYVDDESGNKASEIVSATSPVNTEGDEVSVTEISEDTIIVSSNREGLSGSFDLSLKTITMKPLSVKPQKNSPPTVEEKQKTPEVLSVKINSGNYSSADGIKIKILFFTTLKKNSWPVKTEYQSPDSTGMINIPIDVDIKRILVLPGEEGMKSFAVEFLARNEYPATSTINIEPSEEKAFTAKSFYFRFNSSEIEFADIPYLYELIEYLRQNENVNLLLDGHSDGIGSYKSNMDLSIRRAERIKQFLVKSGIRKDRITTKGSGYVKNSKTDTLQYNRRVETIIIP